MGKRYYCDYCDKSFPYNTQNRKKHNEGSYHQTMRNAYYSQYKDLATILEEEREKKPCYKFFNSGYCAFGDQCRCSHRTPQQIQYLEDMHRIELHKKAVLEELRMPKKKKHKQKKIDDEPKLLLSEYLSREEEELLEKILPKFEQASTLKNYDRTSLPPSLIPPSFKDLIDCNLNTWSTSST